VVSIGLIPKAAYDNDFAIIKLAAPVTFSDRVKPICLPSLLINYNKNRVATVSGWGTTSFGGSQPAILKKVTKRSQGSEILAMFSTTFGVC